MNSVNTNDIDLVQPHRSPFVSCLPFLLPFALLVGLVLFAPNFRWIVPGEDGLPSFRRDPYGGDFLQDWVGGKIVLDPAERHLLYSSDYAKQIQHAPAVIGFAWPEEKYFPMVYPPYHYFLVSPLSLLSYRWATLVWAFLSAAALALSGCLLHRLYPPLQNRSWMLMAGLVAFAPTIITLTMGQKGTWILLLFTSAFLLLKHSHHCLAGTVFALVAIKPQLGIVIGLAMIYKRQSKFFVGATMTLLVLFFGSFFLDAGWWEDYAKVIAGMGDYVSTPGYQLHDSHSLWGGLKFWLPISGEWMAGPLAIVCAVIVLLITIEGIGLQQPLDPKSGQFPFQFSLLVLATVLISPHFYTYDLVILLLPLVLILSSPDVSRSTTNENDQPDPSSPIHRTSISLYWVRGWAVLTFVIAGLLPTINLKTGVPWGVIVILVFIFALRRYIVHLRNLASCPKLG